MPTAVITGASKGIGKAIAQIFAQHSFNLALCARNEQHLLQTKNDLLKINPAIDICCIVADVSQAADRINFCQKVKAQFNTIEVLVNNAGTFLPGNIADEPDGRLEFLLHTNLISAYDITRQLLPMMMAQKSGHIFNISSVAGLQAYPQGGSYGISKFALSGFSKNLRAEMIPYNIKVSTVYAGAVLTDSWAGTSLPSEKFMMPQDVASAIFNAYQLSPSALMEEMVLRPTLGDR